MEPGAASCEERLAALWALHDAGCRTWVSITKLENAGTIDIVRDPALTAAGKKRTFWEEKAGQTVIVRRRT